MLIYAVYRTFLLDKKLEDFSEYFKKQIEGFENQLSQSPYVGKL